MAVKSIIEVQVDDSKFLQFKSVFDDYKKSLEETPGAWAGANSEMGNMVQASQLLKNDAEKRLALLQATTIEESKAEKAAQKSEDARKKATEDRKKKDLESIKRWKELGATIAGATAQLAKFATIGMGLATGAGALGFGKLTNDASAARFQSMGLGMSSGAMQSANINYSSALSNPAANLAAVRDAQQDLSKQKLFATAGIGNYQNKSTEQLLPELMMAAQKMAKQTPQGQLAQTAQAYGYTDVFSMEDLTRFKQMSEQEMQAMIAKAEQDSKALNVNNSTLKSYQDLQKQWDRFGQSMENTWIKGLEPLAPALTRFSEAIGSAFEKFMAADKLEPIINKLAAGITTFSNYLTSPEAEQDFDKLVKNIKEVAATLGTFAAWVGSITPESAAGAAAAVGGGVLAAGAVGAVAGGLALPLAALTATGLTAKHYGNKIYNSEGADRQERDQNIIGSIAAFFGDKDAIAAQKQLADYAKSSDEELKKLKPMTVDEYKKADNDSQAGFIVGIGQVFKTALTDVWEKTKEVAGDVGNAMIGSADAGELPRAASGDQKARQTQAIDYLQKLGRTKEESIGITANLWGESSLNPMTYGGGAEAKGGKSEAYGLMQWHADRRAHYTKNFGHTMQSVTDRDQALKEQLEFANWELSHNEAKGWAQTQAGGKSARAIGAGFARYVERPGDKDGAARNRGGHAEAIEKWYQPSISHSDYKGTPVVTGRGEKDVNGRVKDSYALRKPTADQQKSVMFQDQGGQYGTNSSRVVINVNNSTGGSATASAVSL